MAARCSRFLRHDSHSPVGPGVPPQAHLRCRRPLRTGVKIGGALDEVLALDWSVALIVGVPQRRRGRFACRLTRVSERQSSERFRH